MRKDRLSKRKDINTKMAQILEISHKNFQAAIIEMLQRIITDTLETKYGKSQQ